MTACLHEYYKILSKMINQTIHSIIQIALFKGAKLGFPVSGGENY